MLEYSRYIRGPILGVNGVLHRVPRVRVVCLSYLALVLVTYAALVYAVEVRP